MSGVMQDIRYAFRQICRSLGFAFTVVLTIGLGIAATTTVFSWIRTTLLEPIPAVSRTADLVSVMRGEWNISPTPPFSYLDLQDLSERTRTLSGMLGYQDDWLSITSKEKPERVYGALTTANYFDLLGVRPILGRTFHPGEEKTPVPVVVISHSLWQTHFGADPEIVGKTIEINQQALTIIGVAPQGFAGCKTGLRAQLWMPLSNDMLVRHLDRMKNRGAFWLNVLGKLRPDVSRTSAEQELNRLMQQIVAAYPNEHRGPNVITLDPLWRSPFGANVYLYSSLPLLLGLAIAVMLLACANVATLLLVRSVSRRRELAIRLSLGASRWRITRQMLLESLLLAIGGGVFALLLTSWSAGTFAAFIPRFGSPISLNGRMDGTVAVITILLALFTGAVFGIVPATRNSRLTPVEILKEEAGSVSAGIRRSRLSSSLVVAQVALSMVLLLCAGLFLQTMRNTERADPGFNPQNVLLASIELGPAGYSSDAQLTFQRELLRRLRTVPGVRGAAMADWVPLSLTHRTGDARPEGYVPQPSESMEIRRASISPSYFEVMQIPMLSGRDFNDQDSTSSQPVVIVDDAMAVRYWPGKDPLGRRLRFGGRWFTVVGVVRNSRHFRIDEASEPMFYVPLAQVWQSSTMIHLRTTVNPQSLVSPVVKTIHSLDPSLPVFDVVTLSSSIQLASIFTRIGGTFVGIFGLIALVLASVGIYGVVSYTARQRTHEIGIRMALGASRREVLNLVLLQGIRLLLAGLAAGTLVSVLVARLLRGALFGVSALDPLTMGAVWFLLAAVTIAACLIPACRAIRTDPLQAVRCE